MLSLSKIRDKIQRWRLLINSSVAAKTGQLQLALAWKALDKPLRFDEVEFRAYSQNGEDGILLYIFSLIGTTNKITIEICAGDGTQCNSTNLIVNHGWNGMLVDGSEYLVTRGRIFFKHHPDTFSFPPAFVHAWIDRETVNDLISSNGYRGDVDLLSIDIDGADYWIWEAITVVRPRVVVVEVQTIWPAGVSVSVPYARDFSSPLIEGFSMYASASLTAFAKLASKKGYRLVGCQALGFNCFFMRDDVGQSLFPEMSVSDCLDRPFVRWASDRFLPMVKDRAWVQV